MYLTVQLRPAPSGELLCLSGELDLVTARLVDEAAARLTPGRPCDLDLGDLRFIDVAGARALERCRDRVVAGGATLRLRDATPHVLRVLTLIHCQLPGLSALVADAPRRRTRFLATPAQARRVGV